MFEREIAKLSIALLKSENGAELKEQVHFRFFREKNWFQKTWDCRALIL